MTVHHPAPIATDALSALLALVYQGPLESTPWGSFLEQLRQRLDASFITLVLRNPEHERPGPIVNASSHGPLLPGEPSYSEYYFHLSVSRLASQSSGYGRPGDGQRAVAGPRLLPQLPATSGPAPRAGGQYGDQRRDALRLVRQPRACRCGLRYTGNRLGAPAAATRAAGGGPALGRGSAGLRAPAICRDHRPLDGRYGDPR